MNTHVNYLGLYLPRKNKKNKIITKLNRAINNQIEIEEVQQILAKEIKKGKDLILSEENIVLTSKKTNWKIRITNLFKILEPFEYKIIVTVREPVSAIFSFYVQCYKYFQNLNFNSKIVYNELVEIYRYRIFFEYLINTFGKSSILVKSFEEIIDNDYDDLIDYFNLKNIIDSSKSLSNVNSKRREQNKVIIHIRQPIFKKSIERINKNRYFRLLTFSSRTLSKVLIFVLHLFQYNKRIEIPMPNEKVINEMRSVLKEDILYLKKHFNIDYEK